MIIIFLVFIVCLFFSWPVKIWLNCGPNFGSSPLRGHGWWGLLVLVWCSGWEHGRSAHLSLSPSYVNYWLSNYTQLTWLFPSASVSSSIKQGLLHRVVVKTICKEFFKALALGQVLRTMVIMSNEVLSPFLSLLQVQRHMELPVLPFNAHHWKRLDALGLCWWLLAVIIAHY